MRFHKSIILFGTIITIVLIVLVFLFIFVFKQAKLLININYKNQEVFNDFNISYYFNVYNKTSPCPISVNTEEKRAWSNFDKNDEPETNEILGQFSKDHAFNFFVVGKNISKTNIHMWSALVQPRTLLLSEKYDSLFKFGSDLNYTFEMMFFKRGTAFFFVVGDMLYSQIEFVDNPPSDRIYYCMLTRELINNQDLKMPKCPQKNLIYYPKDEYCIDNLFEKCNITPLLRYITMAEVEGNFMTCKIPLSRIGDNLSHRFWFMSSKEIEENLVETITTRGPFVRGPSDYQYLDQLPTRTLG